MTVPLNPECLEQGLFQTQKQVLRGSKSSKGKEPELLKSFDATRFVSWEAQQHFKSEIIQKATDEKGVDRGSLIGKCQIWLSWRSCVASGKFFLNSCGSLCDLPEHEYLVCMVWGKESDVTLMAGPKFRVDRTSIGIEVREPARMTLMKWKSCPITQDTMGLSWEERFHSLETQVLMKDQFANYVVQKVLENCDDQQLELILNRIKVHLNALKKYTYGKHIVARVEKLVAAGERRISFLASYST
ncbi:hypothetical protein MTR67_026313 [Solanum verrucosum]|uniref:PUM-HD domain-containing protein n=1 Tax=Solanum verrucosum TaxID=315347 RepID=A0AAF0R2J4_SOLVR|nr:hypothetical protein MTR67_026313 [Solanum verrucosum]